MQGSALTVDVVACTTSTNLNSNFKTSLQLKLSSIAINNHFFSRKDRERFLYFFNISSWDEKQQPKQQQSQNSGRKHYIQHRERQSKWIRNTYANRSSLSEILIMIIILSLVIGNIIVFVIIMALTIIVIIFERKKWCSFNLIFEFLMHRTSNAICF